MKADTFIKLLRKVIREEVQSVVREELGILLEAPSPKPVMTESKKTVVKNSLVESIKPTQIQSKKTIKSMNFTNNSILNEMLTQTAQNEDWRSIASLDSSDVMGFGGINEPVVVDSVDQMLSSTRPAGDINSVRIDAVPDFSKLMKTMKEKGQI
jgi:DUF438 domain-containing protein